MVSVLRISLSFSSAMVPGCGSDGMLDSYPTPEPWSSRFTNFRHVERKASAWRVLRIGRKRCSRLAAAYVVTSQCDVAPYVCVMSPTIATKPGVEPSAGSSSGCTAKGARAA